MTGHLTQTWDSGLVPRASVRDQLIASAVDVFHARGFNGSSVQDIVEAAGVPKGSFYNHFASKEALGIEVVKAYSRLVGPTWRRPAPATSSQAMAPPLSGSEGISRPSSSRNVSCGVRKGCLLGNFATELAPHSTEIANAVTEALDNWSAAVSRALVSSAGGWGAREGRGCRGARALSRRRL